MTMWNLQHQHSKLYLIIIGTIYALLITAVIILAAIANDWLFWILASLTNIVIILVGIFSFIKLLKPQSISPPLGETLSYSEATLETKSEES
ncbi:MAG: hypothetical protein KGD64_10065 [Candidatus Heimdallarchaeota archaeon]|nr:hypothetical protein [Candidatus Heimdallarchaeota archaeon]